MAGIGGQEMMVGEVRHEQAHRVEYILATPLRGSMLSDSFSHQLQLND